jgi:hypothetical protein
MSKRNRVRHRKCVLRPSKRTVAPTLVVLQLSRGRVSDAIHALPEHFPWDSRRCSSGFRRAADAHSRRPSEPGEETTARITVAFRNRPPYFIENHGQVDARVTYVQGRDTSVSLTPQGVTIALTGAAGRPPAADQAVARSVDFRTSANSEKAWQRWAVKLDFVGANPEVRRLSQDETSAVVGWQISGGRLPVRLQRLFARSWSRNCRCLMPHVCRD